VLERRLLPRLPAALPVLRILLLCGDERQEEVPEALAKGTQLVEARAEEALHEGQVEGNDGHVLGHVDERLALSRGDRVHGGLVLALAKAHEHEHA
jgi:hypothetical protein